jgi:hypothetical protein
MRRALKALQTSGDYEGVVIHPTREHTVADEELPWYCQKQPHGFNLSRRK